MIQPARAALCSPGRKAWEAFKKTLPHCRRQAQRKRSALQRSRPFVKDFYYRNSLRTGWLIQQPGCPTRAPARVGVSFCLTRAGGPVENIVSVRATHLSKGRRPGEQRGTRRRPTRLKALAGSI